MTRLSLAIVAALVVAPALALAQPHAEIPHNAGVEGEGGEGHGPADEHGAHGAHGADAHHADPTVDFNWVEIHYGKDKWGGPLGDGKAGDRALAQGEKEEPMSGPFVAMVLNFVLLLLILGKFGGPAARKIAQTRSDQIKSALDEAGRLRDQAKAKLDEYTAKLEASDAEIKKMIDGIRAGAEEDRKRVIAAAEVQAAALKKDAEERIAAEIELARYSLAREVAVAASAAAETILREKTTSGDHTKLVEGFISDLGSGPAAPRERT